MKFLSYSLPVLAILTPLASANQFQGGRQFGSVIAQKRNFLPPPPPPPPPSNVIFEHVFEDGGLTGWTITQPAGPQTLWHLAAPGECPLGTSEHGAGYNRFLLGGGCNYNVGTFHVGRLDSPVFKVEGNAPYTVSGKFRRKMDTAPSDSARLWLKLPGLLTGIELVAFVDNSGTLQNFTATIPASYKDLDVYLRFECNVDNAGNNEFGFYLVDEVKVENSGWAASLPPCGESFLMVGDESDLSPGGTLALKTFKPMFSSQIWIFGDSNSDWNGVPLPLFLGRGWDAGCYLRVSPDLVVAGSANLELRIPNDPSLAGQLFFVQALIPLEMASQEIQFHIDP